MKKTCPGALVVVILQLIVGQLSAQVAQEKNQRPKKVYNGPTGHAIGAVISSCNGKGLAYRYWPQNAGFHVSFFPASRTGSQFYNGGVTGYLTLREYEVGKLFLHGGFEYQHMTATNQQTTGYPAYQITESVQTTKGYNIGLGPGIHVLQKYVSMDVFFGYGTYVRKRSSSDPNEQLKNEVLTTLSGGVSLFLEL